MIKFMALIHIKNPRDMCFIHKCRSTELNMQLDFTGPLNRFYFSPVIMTKRLSMYNARSKLWFACNQLLLNKSKFNPSQNSTGLSSCFFPLSFPGGPSFFIMFAHA